MMMMMIKTFRRCALPLLAISDHIINKIFVFNFLCALRLFSRKSDSRREHHNFISAISFRGTQQWGRKMFRKIAQNVGTLSLFGQAVWILLNPALKRITCQRSSFHAWRLYIFIQSEHLACLTCVSCTNMNVSARRDICPPPPPGCLSLKTTFADICSQTSCKL